MKKLIVLIVTGGILSGFLFISCKKDKSSPATPAPPTQSNPVSTSLSGLGDHYGFPSGTIYHLPPNIRVIGGIYGGDPGKKGEKGAGKPENKPYSLPKTNYTQFGYGTFVNCYTMLYNANNSEYMLIIPEGLIMMESLHSIPAPTDTAKSGLIITPDTILIGAHDTAAVCLRSFCLNQWHAAPTVLNQYMLRVITNNDQLINIISALKNKKSLDQHLSEIQDYIWKVTNGPGITQNDLDIMKSWF